MRRPQEEKQPSLFAATDSPDEILLSRRRKQQTKPLPIRNVRVLEETKRVCGDFHEIFEAPCDRLGLSDVFTERQTMARRLFRQAVPPGLAAPESGQARRLSKEEGSEAPVEKFYRMMGSGKRRPYQAPARYRLPRGDGPLGRQGRSALLRFYDAQLCFGQ